uniref:Major facilitator superfamily (MFS) profile domain-containing protein n=1 Tax=Kwoniella bestiolae CBS 10118 TaxID=1296100 RepID=A0A1B9G2W2_9TREE|nr:hypothetical protein I302_05182 [Kwoniella bestiolae CBS 10118]OCF25363.1 hypothetical protein I302_05182 [Kwoniella bestiolae CBS 10118]
MSTEPNSPYIEDPVLAYTYLKPLIHPSRTPSTMSIVKTSPVDVSAMDVTDQQHPLQHSSDLPQGNERSDSGSNDKAPIPLYHPSPAYPQTEEKRPFSHSRSRSSSSSSTSYSRTPSHNYPPTGHTDHGPTHDIQNPYDSLTPLIDPFSTPPNLSLTDIQPRGPTNQYDEPGYRGSWPSVSGNDNISYTPVNTGQRTHKDDLHGQQKESQEDLHPLAQLPSLRKHILLFIFSVATFVDLCNVSGAAVAVAQISQDIGLGVSQAVWIISSYSLAFAAFLLFAGRLSDLYAAQVVFQAGFLMLGILSLITSFVTSNKYGFLVLRGLGGVCGAMNNVLTICSHLIVHLFPTPEIRKAKLAIISLAGGLGNVLGLVLAGLCMIASYKWFFRLIAIICITLSVLCIIILLYTKSSRPQSTDPLPRWKRLDAPGVILMTGFLVCFILSLTQGPIDGWGSASFIAPFIISLFSILGFFLWESRIPPRTAVLPSSIWKITNILHFTLTGLIAFPFWSTTQLQYATWWQELYYWKALHVAAAILPQGIISIVAVILARRIPAILNKPRYAIGAGMILIDIALILMVFSDGGEGNKYWRFVFPAFVLGGFGAMITHYTTAISIVTYSPPEGAGVSGTFINTVAQIGASLALSVQAGLQDTSDAVPTWENSGSRTWHFMIAWTTVLGLQFTIFFKPPGTPEEEHEATRRRIREKDGDSGF